MVHVVFLPGLLCTDLLFSHQIKNLPGNFSPDCFILPLGKTMEEISEIIWEEISGSVVLVGLSMGGIAAMEMYRQHPERILGMVFLDTNFRDEIKDVSDARFELVDLAGRTGPGEMSLKELLPVLVHTSLTGDPFIKRIVFDMAEKYGIDRISSHADALASRQNYSDILAEVNCPVLIIHGSDDKLCPVEIHKHMETIIPGSKRVEINNCGHLSSLEKPELVSIPLNKWLEEYFQAE
jgi:pimeloyl-ACP methyl ester carboxylesterase